MTFIKYGQNSGNNHTYELTIWMKPKYLNNFQIESSFFEVILLKKFLNLIEIGNRHGTNQKCRL